MTLIKSSHMLIVSPSNASKIAPDSLEDSQRHNMSERHLTISCLYNQLPAYAQLYRPEIDLQIVPLTVKVEEKLQYQDDIC